MTVHMNLKRKPERFKGDLPTWGASVTGASYYFTKELERLLDMHGFAPFAIEPGRSSWTLKPSICQPPLYLAAILKAKHDAVLSSDIRKMLTAATAGRKPDDDGLQKFLGRPASDPAGRHPLRIEAGSKVFVANCDEDDIERRNFLVGAGWHPIATPAAAIVEKFGTMPFRTSDAYMALNLAGFMSPAAKSALKASMATAMTNFTMSGTHRAPADFDLPAPEGIDYLPFQKTGIAMFAEPGKSGLIADDMGLGKTIQGIGIINDHLRQRPDARNILVLCQANMKIKWCREIDKWKLDPDLKADYAMGSEVPETDVVTINYDIAARNIEKLRQRRWDLVLTDEAHNLANEEAQRTQAVLGRLLGDTEAQSLLMATGGKIIHLTGTPRPNKVENLWPLLSSTAPHIWGRGPEARREFLNRYAPPTLIQKEFSKNGRSWKRIIPLPGKPMREKELQLRLRGSGCFVRRMKRDAKDLGLPPKFRTPLEMPIKLSKEQQKQLTEIEVDFAALVEEAGTGRGIKAGESKMASAVIDAVKGAALHSPEFHENARLRKNLGLLKAPLAAQFMTEELKDDEDLDPELRRKTVIFAHHKEVIQLIHKQMSEGVKGDILIYDGSITSEKKRQAIIDRFQTDDRVRAIIISLSGASGITLTRANRMRVVEMDWLPSNMVQIEDRIWRIGQEQNVDIGYLFIPNSLDAQIGQGIIARMESEEASLNKLSFEDLEAKKAKAEARGARRSAAAAQEADEDAFSPSPSSRDADKNEPAPSEEQQQLTMGW
ncbi:DEAD/DEAH box helicase [Palleronia sp.]|uniref:DEAD/DEAH box helicase n=1 Tax=Palleronia sp. TaxID=1940284 RepID=UPI0035C7F826